MKPFFKHLPTPPAGLRLTTDRVTYAQFVFTREIAEYLLQHCNNKNRSLKQTTVDAICRDLRNSTYRDNGQSIGVDREGNLTDGQHRLTAVVKTGIPIVAHLDLGLDPAVRGTIDRQSPRTNADDYRILTGNADSAILSTRANAIKKAFQRRRDPTSYALFSSIAEEFRVGLSAVNRLVKGKSGIGRAPFMGAFAVAITAYPRKGEELLKSLIGGPDAPTFNTPAWHALHSYVMRGFGNDSEDQIIAKTLNALRRHFEGEMVERLNTRWAKDDLAYFTQIIENKRGATLQIKRLLAPAHAA